MGPKSPPPFAVSFESLAMSVASSGWVLPA
jgi:hypothetical protein